MIRFCFSKYSISIRAPAKGATICIETEMSKNRFQSALPRRERHTFLQRKLPAAKFQSALPRRERRMIIYRRWLMNDISIRAPAKGATCQGKRQGTVCHNFNPRSREGSDYPEQEKPVDHMISIRAPAKGATRYSASIHLSLSISIRAPAKGATSIFAKKFSSLLAKIV